ncbi:hypothetical protein TNCV_1862191 [Trichonephila clavipes]|nr:hypothetical protein TNCV_1862191 [Trichonephila clavipes]
MAQMETDPPDITNSCEERNRLSLEIEALDIVINRCTELVNFPDTDDNHEMKAILRACIGDTQRKKGYNEYGHSACYTKCPKFPKPKKVTPLTANKTFQSNVRREGASFANIVSGTASSSTPTPVHKLTEKTNEYSNNKVSHGIQAIENENSDLDQVIELVSMISNIIKGSPEILQLLPKLKYSEDDKAKALLLFETMLRTISIIKFCELHLPNAGSWWK